MHLKPAILTSLIFVLLIASSYVVYIMLGGQLGRSFVKAANFYMSLNNYRVLDETGDGCTGIGEWNEHTLTCLFTEDIEDGTSFLITGNGITLDGNGFSLISLEGIDRAAVVLSFANDSAVKNLIIRGYRDGILLNFSDRNLLNHITVSEPERYGFHIENDSNYNLVEANRVYDTGYHGISLLNSHGNSIVANSITNARDAIRLQTSNSNLIAANTTNLNRIEAIDLHTAKRNTIVFNNIFDLDAIPMIFEPRTGLDNQIGLMSTGNYYAAHSSPENSCEDRSSDGICDEPFEFQGGSDSYASVAPLF